MSDSFELLSKSASKKLISVVKRIISLLPNYVHFRELRTTTEASIFLVSTEIEAKQNKIFTPHSTTQISTRFMANILLLSFRDYPVWTTND